jgi:hypothetical protein
MLCNSFIESQKPDGKEKVFRKDIHFLYYCTLHPPPVFNDGMRALELAGFAGLV